MPERTVFTRLGCKNPRAQWCLLSVLGVCFRLYPQSLYEEGMPEARCPGVAEANLSHLVLFLKRLDIADMGQCKFLDRPGQDITMCFLIRHRINY